MGSIFEGRVLVQIVWLSIGMYAVVCYHWHRLHVEIPEEAR